MKLPTISIASHRVTRLIIGGNPYSGISHRSTAASQAMIDYYTTIQIIMDLRQAERSGINTVLARADRHIMRVLNEYWNAGGTIQWIAQTPKDTEYADLNEYLQIIARYKPIAIYHHGGTTDKLYAEGRLEFIAGQPQTHPRSRLCRRTRYARPSYPQVLLFRRIRC